MSFCAAINCMDGRVQVPVIEYLRERCGVEYVDIISEPGPVRILSARPDSADADSIFERVEVSVKEHGIRSLALAAHFDCGGNPLPKGDQLEQLGKALNLLYGRYPDLEIIGLWVDAEGEVEEIEV